MKHNIQDLTGQKFVHLTALYVSGIGVRGRRIWRCICVCGKYRDMTVSDLKTRPNASCGCKNKPGVHYTHGMAGTPIHKLWVCMKARTRPNQKHNYPDYAGRGIKMCKRWGKFENFYKDMGPSYKEGLTIDRIDYDGHYKPSNCRWATMIEQARNRRNNRMVTINGETKCAKAWAEFFKVGLTMALSRMNKGWEPHEAYTVPSRELPREKRTKITR